MILRALGLVLAAAAHAAFLFFGGLLLPAAHGKSSSMRVELLSEEMEQQKKEDKPQEEQKPEEQIAAETEKPPEVSEIISKSEPANQTPALDAASLGAIEAALSGASGGGEFGGSVNFAGGGRIGGTGRPGSGGGGAEGDNAFGMDEIDQKPRVVVQTPPSYPAELRSKKMAGVVNLILVVDAAGRVCNPRVERSTHPAFDKAALSAVRQWKFEPALKGGRRVSCRMRVPIRFNPA